MAGETGVVMAAMPSVTNEQRELLDDFLKAIPLTKVDRLMGWRCGTARGAVERGEMRYIQMPGAKHVKVTPQFIAEWMEEYCVCKKPLLAGWNEVDAS